MIVKEACSGARMVTVQHRIHNISCRERLTKPRVGICSAQSQTRWSGRQENRPASATIPSINIRKYDADSDGKLSLNEVEQLLADVQISYDEKNNHLKTLNAMLGHTMIGSQPASNILPTKHLLVPARPSFEYTLQQTPGFRMAPKPVPKKSTWDQHLLQSIQSASNHDQSLSDALREFMSEKLTGQSPSRPMFSEIVWSAVFMAVCMLSLAAMQSIAASFPIVGQFHDLGLKVLLGSFGTVAILLFGKPDAEVVRVWPVVMGQMASAAIAVACLALLGPTAISRAVAMGAVVAFMMWTDSLHPPGGALVVIAMDNAAVQQMGAWYVLYPSLLFTLLLVMPLSASCNWFKANVRFTWEDSVAAATKLLRRALHLKHELLMATGPPALTT